MTRLVLLLLFVAIVVAVVMIVRMRSTAARRPLPPPTPDPREILRRRYAAGEIDEDEYLRRMSGLSQEW